MDQVLICRCQAGDEEAFGLLFEQHKNLVYHTVYLTLGTTADGPAPVTTGGTPPDMPSVTYKNANALTWVVNGARVEVLSNLSVVELQKIAEGLVLSD